MWAWPHRIEFHFLPEVSTQGLQANQLDQLKQKYSQNEGLLFGSSRFSIGNYIRILSNSKPPLF